MGWQKFGQLSVLAAALAAAVDARAQASGGNRPPPRSLTPTAWVPESPSATSAVPASPARPSLDALSAYRLGCLRLDAGEALGAIDDLRAAVAKRPDEITFSLSLAEAYLAADRPADAANLLGMIRSDGEYGRRIAELRGVAAAAQRDWPGCVVALKPFEPELGAEARLLLAEAYSAQRRTVDASAVRQRAAEAFPRSPAVMYSFALDALNRGQFATAQTRIREAQRAGLPQGLVWALEADALLGRGQLLGRLEVRSLEDGQIGQLLDDGVVIAPTDHGKSAEAGSERGDPAGESNGGIRDWRVATGASAILAARRAIHEGVDTPDAWIVFARGLQAAAQERAAWEIVSRQLEVLLDGAEPRVLQAAADVALSAGKLKEFLLLREKSVAGATDDEQRAALVLTYRTLAEAYNLRGDERSSLAFLQRAYELAPSDLDTRLLLADALWVSGDRLGACEHYRELLALSPAHAERRRIFGRLQEFAEADRPVVAGAQVESNSGQP